MDGSNLNPDILIGTVSWGRGCAIYPGVYSRVSQAYDWIRGEVCYKSIDPPDYLSCQTSERGPIFKAMENAAAAAAETTLAQVPSLSPSQTPTTLAPTLLPTKRPTRSPTTFGQGNVVEQENSTGTSFAVSKLPPPTSPPATLTPTTTQSPGSVLAIVPEQIDSATTTEAETSSNTMRYANWWSWATFIAYTVLWYLV